MKAIKYSTLVKIVKEIDKDFPESYGYTKEENGQTFYLIFANREDSFHPEKAIAKIYYKNKE